MKISNTDSLHEDNDKKYTNCHLDNDGFSTKHKFHSIDKSESIVINLKGKNEFQAKQYWSYHLFPKTNQIIISLYLFDNRSCHSPR